MPAGKTKKSPEEIEAEKLAAEEAAAQEAAEQEPDEEIEFQIEVPAVGESVCYVEWDEARLSYFEYAALITAISPSGEVQLVVFAPHSRAGRSMQDVKYSEEADMITPFTHWRYPRAAPVDTFQE